MQMQLWTNEAERVQLDLARTVCQPIFCRNLSDTTDDWLSRRTRISHPYIISLLKARPVKRFGGFVSPCKMAGRNHPCKAEILQHFGAPSFRHEKNTVNKMEIHEHCVAFIPVMVQYVLKMSTIYFRFARECIILLIISWFQILWAAEIVSIFFTIDRQ